VRLDWAYDILEHAGVAAAGTRRASPAMSSKCRPLIFCRCGNLRVDRPGLKDPAFVPSYIPAFTDRGNAQELFATLR